MSQILSSPNLETTPMPTPYRVLFAVVVLLVLTALGMSFALAATVCLPFSSATEKLASIGQEITHIATTANGTTVFVAVNPKTGDWSLFAEPNYDKACVLMFGEGWETAPDSVRHPPTN
jgi:hypothetical protein